MQDEWCKFSVDRANFTRRKLLLPRTRQVYRGRTEQLKLEEFRISWILAQAPFEFPKIAVTSNENHRQRH